MTPELARSYSYCERVARREAGNFYHAFRLLPSSQRRAMCALYTFMRIADDLADGSEPSTTKEVRLSQWREDLCQARKGIYSHKVHPALHHTIVSHRIPPEYLDAVVDGVCMDLGSVRYDTFEELYRYCYHVASAVGLACIHVWGFKDEKAKLYAEQAGIAFQLTNILRDLGDDAGRGRIYLPREDLLRFGYTAEQLERGERNERFRALMRFQVERARGYYEASEPLANLLEPQGQSVFLVMLRTYRSLLDTIQQRDFDVFSSRVRLSNWWKLAILVRALPVRWGWAG